MEIVQEFPLQGKRMLFNADYRLFDLAYSESSVSFVYIDNFSETTIFSSSIFLIKEENFVCTRFWYFNQKEYTLNHITLKDILNNYNFAMTVGYTQMINNNFKYRIISSFIEIIKTIISENKIFVFIECTGKENMSKNLIENPILHVNEHKVNISNLGVTRAESTPVEKFSRHIGLEKYDNLYNRRTLGPVFCTKAYT